jgi:CheY-like chemotaxis protein
VLAAGSADEALRVLEQNAGVELLFTDVVIPGGMSGRELADAARARVPGLRVLYTSGYTENAIVHQGRLDSEVTFLAKPYRRDELAAKIASVLEGD